MHFSRVEFRYASLSRRFAATHIDMVFFGVAASHLAVLVAGGIKKVAESFGGFRIKNYLCTEQIFKPMTNKTTDWVITGVSTLTGAREEIASAASYDEVIEIMDAARAAAPRAFTKLRAERLTPRQLTILIEEI